MNFVKIFQRLLPIPKEYEKIELILKAHWLEFVPQVLLFLLLSAIPPGGYYFLSTFEPELLNTQWLPLIFILGGSAWYLFTALLLFTNFTDFFLDVWIVTNERVITIHQLGLFDRVVSEARLYQIQDVTSTVRGPFHSMFGFGNVIVETAGTKGQLIFNNIPNPTTVARRILELVEGDRKYHEEKIRMLKMEEQPKIIDSGA